MPIAFSYLRFSTKRQSNNDSYRRQTEALKAGLAWAEKEGYTLDESFHLEDLGLSGWKKTNILSPKAALAGFLSDIRKGRVRAGSVLIIESLDRLTRADMDEALSLFLEILRAGVGIKTFTPDRLYTREILKDNPVIALLEPIIIFARGNEESSRKSGLVKAAFAEMRTSGEGYFPGRKPAWVDRVEGDDISPGGYVEIKEKADVVRQIYEWAADGVGIPTIAKKLNATTPPIGSSKRWSTSYVAKILHSRAVLGEIQPHKLVETSKEIDGKEVVEISRVPDGEVRRNHFPAIVSEEVYYRAQASIARRSNATGRTPTKVNLFQNLIYCENDGSAYHIGGRGRATKDRPDVRRLVSADSMAGVEGSCSAQVDYPSLEAAFLRFCDRELRSEDFRGEDKEAELIGVLEGKASDLAKRVARTQKLIDNAANDDEFETFVRQMGKLEGQIKGISEEIEAARGRQSDRATDTASDLKSLVEILKEAEDKEPILAQIQARVRQLVRRVDVWTEDHAMWRHVFVCVDFYASKARVFHVAYCLRPKHFDVWYCATTTTMPGSYPFARRFADHLRPMITLEFNENSGTPTK